MVPLVLLWNFLSSLPKYDEYKNLRRMYFVFSERESRFFSLVAKRLSNQSKLSHFISRIIRIIFHQRRGRSGNGIETFDERQSADYMLFYSHPAGDPNGNRLNERRERVAVVDEVAHVSMIDRHRYNYEESSIDDKCLFYSTLLSLSTYPIYISANPIARRDECEREAPALVQVRHEMASSAQQQRKNLIARLSSFPRVCCSRF